MSKNDGILGAAGKVITYILVVLLVLGIAGMAAYFVLRSQGVTFYVVYDGERYLANGDGGSLELLNGETHTFSVKSLTGGEVNYSVKVTSNGANNFSFTTGGEIWYLWNDDETKDDYTDIFEVEKSADSFSITIPQDFTVEQALETKYGGDITFLEDISENESYFTVVVTVDNSNVALCFSFGGVVESITLNPPSVIF